MATPTTAGALAFLKEEATKNGCKFIDLNLPVSKVRGELCYKLVGDKTSDTLLVCIHGIGGGMVHFREQMDAFSKSGILVLGFDFFGRGLSLPPRKKSCCSNVNIYDTLMHVEQISCLITELGLSNIPTINLCAFSMGGAICMRFLDHYRWPNVKNVAMISPAGLLDPIVPITCLRCMCCDCLCPFGLNCLTSCLGRILSPQEEDDRKAFFNKNAPVVEEMIRTTAACDKVNSLQTAIFKSAARVKEISRADSLITRVLQEQTSIRYLFLWGKDDLYVPVDPNYYRYQEACKKAIPVDSCYRYRFELIEDCGHCSLLENPRKVNEILNDFYNMGVESVS